MHDELGRSDSATEGESADRAAAQARLERKIERLKAKCRELPRPSHLATSGDAAVDQVERQPIAAVAPNGRRRATRTMPTGLPPGVTFVAKVAAFITVTVGLYYGPSYYSCRQLKERGMFFYGTSVESCVRERLASQAKPLDLLLQRSLPSL